MPVTRILSNGDSFVVAEWIPDPSVIQAVLLKLNSDLDNMSDPLADAKAAFIEDTRLHFETEFDPYGEKWTPLEEEYLVRRVREGHTGKILHVDGELERAATAPTSWIITERDIIFNVEAIPFYGPYHQSGTLNRETHERVREQRFENLELEEYNKNIREYNAKIKEYNLKNPRHTKPYKSEFTRKIPTFQPGAGKGNALPQRQFIGADDATIEEIVEIFERWLDNTVDKDYPIMTFPTVFTGLNIMGEFPIISFLTTGQPILKTPEGPRFGQS